MSAPRLVVVEGRDLGAEYLIPPSGGGIGRGETSFARLGDPSVSRHHCSIARRGDAFVLLDAKPKPSTRVNGRVVAEHVLSEGDEIAVGATRLSFLPGGSRSPGVATASMSRVTVELAADEMFRAGAEAPNGRGPAHRHLAALARLGDGLREAEDREAIARRVSEAVREALGASRALLFGCDASGALTLLGASIAAGDPLGEELGASKDVLDKVLVQGRALILEAAAPDEVGRVALAAPLGSAKATGARGLLFADREATRGAFAEPDLELAACVAHLATAALASMTARDALARENVALEERLGTSRDFIGDSAEARAVLALTTKLGRSDTTVLVLGESGAGKELVASAIHRASKRASGPFVCVNCAALTESVLESELFGHEKGAFTGATERQIGRFETADSGTLFLDEVGEISMKCQAKFLRVLEERRFERVGGSRSIAVDVRVVAATNRDLEAMIRAGEFREDLFFRLSVIRVEVPPLRARAHDIPLIAEALLERLRFQTGRRVTAIAADAKDALMAYSWPGNVRELRNAIEHAIVLGEGDVLRAADLPPHVLARARSAVTAPASPSAALGSSAPKTLRELEREGIVAALAATGGNKAQAAALLEIDRTTLYKKLKDYGLVEG